MLEWNALYYDFNSKRVRTYNIFSHGGFLEDCRKAARKYKNDKSAFLEAVSSSLQYFFWCKCEWEVIVSAWPPSEKFRESKIDIFSQVMMNWTAFEEYIWTHAAELRRRSAVNVEC